MIFILYNIKMNYVFLLVIAFILVILIAVILLTTHSTTTVTGTTGGVLPNPTSCNTDVNNLPNLSFNPCCNVFGLTTNTRFLDTLNMVVSPIAVPYISVCSGFCTVGYSQTSGACIPTTNGSDSGQNNFLLCTANTAPPAGCTLESLPVAFSNTQLLYPASATNLLCQSTSPCGITG